MAKMCSGLRRLAESAGVPVQVAAVCYRMRGLKAEFLLVNTSSGKWTFPKGRLEPALTGSQTAALEAWEEAGAKGRIEEDFFASYLDAKRALGHNAETREVMIAAYLLEVRSTVEPGEAGRNPSWFSAEQAKTQLLSGRASRYHRQVAQVVDVAVERLAAKHARTSPSWQRQESRRRMATMR